MGGNRYKSRADKRRSKKTRKGFQKKKIVDDGNAEIVDEAARVVDTDPSASYAADVSADFTVDNDDLSLSSRKLKRKLDESINAAYD